MRDLAQTAIVVQRQLDAERTQDLGFYQRAARDLPPAAQGLLAALLPGRLAVMRFEVETEMLVEQQREIGFGVHLLPINLSYRSTFGVSSERASRIKVEVTRVPIVPGEDRP